MPLKDVFKKFVSSVSAAAVLFSCCFNFVFADGLTGLFDPGFNYSCKAFYMENIDTSTVVVDLNSKQRLYPASVTKLTTALLAVEAIERGDISLDDEVTAIYDDFNDMVPDGSTAAISRGETLTVEQLLYCMMVASANEACNILSRYISGSTAAFVGEMNRRVTELGCIDTNYINPHGLHSESHYSCAYDVAIIFKEAIKHEFLRTLMSTKEYTFSTNLRESYTVRTGNYLLDDSRCTIQDGYTYEYEYLLGGKTGNTSAAGACLASYAEKDGKTYVCVALGGERESKYTTNYAMKDTRESYIWAFSSLSERAIVDTSQKVAEVPVSLSFDSEFVSVLPAQEITALIPNDYDVSLFAYKFNLPDNLVAPISKGDVIGSMDVVFDGEVLGSVDLIADRDIERSVTLDIVDKFEKFVGTWWFWAIIGILAALLIIYIVIAIIVNTRRHRTRRRNSTSYRRGVSRRGRRFK